MQSLNRRWNNGIRGKLIILSGLAILGFFLCIICSLIWSQTPSGQQAVATTQATTTRAANQLPPTSIPPPSPTTPPPTPSRARLDGLAIETAFQSQGFIFQPGTPVNGQPRRNGTSPNGLATVELIGPPTSLTQTSILVALPANNPQAIQTNGLWVALYLGATLPTWTDSTTWLTTSLKAFEAGQEEVTTTHNGRTITMTNLKPIGMLSLTIE